MNTSTAKRLPVTAAEYLEGERKSEVRHEFVDGRIYVMSGGPTPGGSFSDVTEVFTPSPALSR